MPIRPNPIPIGDPMTIQAPAISTEDQAIAAALLEVRRARQPAQSEVAREALHRASVSAFGFPIPPAWSGRVDVHGTTARGHHVDLVGLHEGDKVSSISLHAQAATGFVLLIKLSPGGEAALEKALALEDRLAVIHAHAIENELRREELFAQIEVKRAQLRAGSDHEEWMAAEMVRREADVRASAAEYAHQEHQAQELKRRGLEIQSSIDALTRWSDGERIFAFHEQGDEPHEVRSLEELNSYAPDQLIALPAQDQEHTMQANGKPAPRADAIDSITVGDGKYTVQLGVSKGRFSFTALRNGEPWRDMSGDGDGLMVAMFHHMLDQQARIAQLESQLNAPASGDLHAEEAAESPEAPSAGG